MDVKPDARTKLLEAATGLIRAQGYAGTSVDEICRAAGVTKGAFFHHFRTKDDLAVAAARHWSETTSAMFAAAPYHDHSDPLARVLAYIDFRTALLDGAPAEFTCLVGTMVQEAYEANHSIRDACEASISGHARTLVADIQEAMERHGVNADWTAESLALHTQVVLQGAFILAKARGGPEIARESARHLRRYVELLFARRSTEEEP